MRVKGGAEREIKGSFNVLRIRKHHTSSLKGNGSTCIGIEGESQRGAVKIHVVDV